MVVNQIKEKIIDIMTIGVAGWLIAITTIRIIQKYFPDSFVYNYIIAIVLLIIGLNRKNWF